MWSRRRFIATSAALAANCAIGAERDAYTAMDYERATVIDALGVLGDPDPSATIETAPSARLLKDLRDSGLTAVSVTLSVGSIGDRIAKFIHRVATLDELVAAAPDVLMRIHRATDLDKAKATRRLGLIYNVQDTSLLENDLSRVAMLRALGLRVMQMTYNTRNLVGDGCLERADSGLSNLGRDLVAELNRTRVVMDLSHGGRTTIAEAIREAKAPPVISHTGCRDLHDHPRNVFDTELKALAARGGVVGIYFMPFLVPRGNATKADLIRHIEHAVNVCGEDHVGLGTDGDISAHHVDEQYLEAMRKRQAGRVAQRIASPEESVERYRFISEYNHPRRFLSLAEDLSARGWPARRIDKLLGGNFARVYTEVWD
ncbi:MAG TPA: membrane dipeptidase [Steroidobacter sp.]|uniref:dipeptidase n=1 Tax=Steroidobacter sp. TaxID=1978227 RepID=UPI002ED8CE30